MPLAHEAEDSFDICFGFDERVFGRIRQLKTEYSYTELNTFFHVEIIACGFAILNWQSRSFLCLLDNSIKELLSLSKYRLNKKPSFFLNRKYDVAFCS